MRNSPVMISVILAVAGIKLAMGGDMNDTDTMYVRPPAVAGAFYPGSPSELARMIAGQFHAAPKPKISGKPVALIAPHAGYIYSGGIAARGYKILEGEEYSTVVVISPSHMIGFHGVTAFAGKAYTTPLGEIAINRELTRKIASGSKYIEMSNVGHLINAGRSEHALEVQLPFLQTALRNFSLVALMMGDQDYQTCEALGKAIGDAVDGGDDILIVASSDLSHFYDSKTAGKLDSEVVDRVSKFDFKGLASDLSSGKAEACGGGPIVAAMIAAKKIGADSVDITGYGDSGDVTGDKSEVVGYLSALIYKSAHAKTYDLDEGSDREEIRDNPASGVRFGLSPADKKTLLSIARHSIEAGVEGRTMMFSEDFSDPLKEPRGAFVTLTRNGALRGCIGTFVAEYPLFKTVARMAREAAFSDPRFPPVGKDELPDLEVEISVLTPMQKIEDPQTVKVGEDGLYIRQGMFAGVLLPQVPVDYGWDREKFLQQTCLKAGLPPGAWKEKSTELYIFQAEIFGED